MAEIYDVWTIREPKKDGDKAFWIKLGAAFENKDGSFNVFLDGYPVNGKLHIRKRKEKDFSQSNSSEPKNFDSDDDLPF